MVLVRKRKVFTTTTKITARGRTRVVYSRHFRAGLNTEESNKQVVPAEDVVNSFTDKDTTKCVAESQSGSAFSSVESEKPEDSGIYVISSAKII